MSQIVAFAIRCAVVALIVLLVSGQPAVATGLSQAADYIARGSALYLQGAQNEDVMQRDRVLMQALKSFKHAYRMYGHATKAQALLGAAQCYVLVSKLPSRFPFLWSASPLQRAEKDLIQALVWQPHDPAAELLLGLVYHHQATVNRTGVEATSQRSRTYFARAAEDGLPVLLQMPTSALTSGFRGFDRQDTVLILRYIDAAGHGQRTDLLFVYRPAHHYDTIYGAVVVNHTPYPLIADEVRGTVIREGVLTAVDVLSQDHGHPTIEVRSRLGTTLTTQHFRWHGQGFQHLEADGLSP
ncbi:hypothetical protein NKDENANG_01573 [Candidatus Entotheonellaceae bacterium PAL068K]